MTGSASYARDADVAPAARERLDRVADASAAAELAQRALLTELVQRWPTSAWRAAGATSAKRWLLVHTHCSEAEAHRLERIAGLCHRHPTLAHAVLAGQLALSRADTLGRAVADEREPGLAGSLAAFLRLDARGCPTEDWSTAIRHWTGLVDQERTVRQVPRHSLTIQRLFGGGRNTEACRRRRARRRTRARSAVRVDVHLDLRTLAGLRDVDDLDDLVLRGDGWRLTRQAAERLLCDSAMVAVRFAGRGHVLDANDAAETWTPRRRRAIAARDRHCVYPSCTRPPRHCDVHHLEHRSEGGPTRTSNGALLCRFHHRLLQEHGWNLTVEDGRWIATDRHGTRWTGRPLAPDQPTDESVS